MEIRTLRLLGIGVLIAPAIAAADDGAFAKCRAIPDPAARLACYDALPAGGATQGRTPEETTVSRLQERFGLLTLADKEIAAIQSRIPGRFEGWGPNTTIELANGQLWQVADGSSRVLDLTDPNVTIRRGALGAFYLEFERDNRTVRVRRLR